MYKGRSKFIFCCFVVLPVILVMFGGSCGGVNKVNSRVKTSIVQTKKDTQKNKSINKTNINENNKNGDRDKLIPFGFDLQNGLNYILFIKDNAGDTIKRIDARKINPYWGWRYPIDYISYDTSNFTYDLKNMPEEEKDSILNEIRITPNINVDRNDIVISNAMILYPIIDFNKDNAFINFNIRYFIDDEMVIGSQGYVYVINKNGDIINEIKDSKDDFSGIYISSSGKYFLQQFGHEYGEEGGIYSEFGFKVYNTYTGKKIYEINFGMDPYFKSAHFLPNTDRFVLVHRDIIKITEFSIIDLKTKILYQKQFDKEKFYRDDEYERHILENFLKEKTIENLFKDGFVLKQKNNIIR